jgi:hypothetical protein
MSTHFTRRGGTSADSRDDSPARTRERRFRRDDRDDVPVSPLVAEQQERELRAGAPVRDRATAGGAGGPGGWRSTVAAVSGLNVLAGIWLIIAPFVLGYGGGDPYWNDIVFGAITAAIAFARFAGAYRESQLSWTGALIGIWIFVSAFWLDHTGTAGINDIILGAIVFVLAVASATATDEGISADRRGLSA